MTMHDISLVPRDAKEGVPSGQLVLEGTVKTYRYLDDEEAAEVAAAAATVQGAK